jgi:hypothetical protein
MDLYDIFQERRIHDAASAATTAQGKADRLDLEVSQLAKRVDRLTLVCHALWELLSEQTNLTETDIRAKIMEIDERDGTVDGKMHAPVFNCINCGRPNNGRRQTCLYCGALVATENALGL